MSNYDADSIKQLSFKEGVRTRVSMYLGSPDNDGVLNAFFEVVNNATDEALAGYGDEILIEISPEEKSFMVSDKGRGIPRGATKDSEEILITLMTTSHSGGKFDKEAYAGFSRGLNGIGVGATCMSSDYMKIITKRDGATWEIEFKKGDPLTNKAIQGEKTKETGSTFIWSPSQEVFSAEEIVIDIDNINSIIEEYSFFNPGVRFIVRNKDTNSEWVHYSKNGIQDFGEKVIRQPLHKFLLTKKIKEEGVEVEALAKWTEGHERFYLFVNGAECPDGGQPITGAKTAITRTINNLASAKFNGELIRKGFVYIISIKHSNPMFSNQTKTRIGNPELRKICDRLFSDMIKEFSEQSPQEFQSLVKTFGKIEKAEEAAEKAREAILQSTKEIERASRKKVFASDKLKDASKLGQESILLLVEGKSAAASMVNARDHEKYGVLALRGKVINALSNDEEKIYNNEEVKIFLSAMGINPTNYRSKKLRYGRAAICVDGDQDGYHISLLIMSLIHKLAPEFLEEGRLLWLKAPLYRVSSKGQNHYYYSEEELSKGKKGEQTRFKGLGELGTTDTKASMFNPKNQRLEVIKYSKEGIVRLEELMGKDISFRKDFVLNKIDFSQLER